MRSLIRSILDFTKHQAANARATMLEPVQDMSTYRNHIHFPINTLLLFLLRSTSINWTTIKNAIVTTYSGLRTSKTSTMPSEVPDATSECFEEYAQARTGASWNDRFWNAYVKKTRMRKAQVDKSLGNL